MCNTYYMVNVGLKKGLLFGFAVFFGLVAIFLGVFWSQLYSSILKNKLELAPGSMNYDMWQETPIPMYLDLYLFNWTNPDNLHTEKPNFVQMGPYVFSEVHKRVGITFNPNNTVSFNQTRTWNFEPKLSNGTLDDEITNLNPVLVTVGYMVRYHDALTKLGVKGLIKITGEHLTVTKTARELLFEGYDDKLLYFAEKLDLKGFEIPFDKFGWFYNRNKNPEYDGRFTMYTGVDDLSKLGIVERWNGQNQTRFFPGECGAVSGTTGEVWPPLTTLDPVSVFAGDVCRPVSLKYKEPITRLGVSGNKYIGDESVFDNGTIYKDMSCYCLADDCPDLKSGMLNVSSCRYGAPAFASYPHFYLSDESYADAVTGLKPDKELHEFTMALEPSTGIPLEVAARLQINMLLEPIEGLGILEDVPRVFIPMLWFTQHAELTEEFASLARLALNVTYLGHYIAIGLGVIAIIMIAIGIYLVKVGPWKGEDGVRLLTGTPAASTAELN